MFDIKQKSVRFTQLTQKLIEIAHYNQKNIIKNINTLCQKIDLAKTAQLTFLIF